ncbi:hypothetical protein F6Y24_03070 [Xanthomonas arboricola pv. pruni]|nr:hypothetical protein C1H21_02055 [Xanthomonas arboricola pv. juglandis]QEX76156.1 hypothetical protein F6Y24_03070 [Xanthomonas arboricola pv. pruni]RST64481.1 hypothetical protein EJK96_20640 [Xanthomonas arboricola pv. pruni]
MAADTRPACTCPLLERPELPAQHSCSMDGFTACPAMVGGQGPGSQVTDQPLYACELPARS